MVVRHFIYKFSYNLMETGSAITKIYLYIPDIYDSKLERLCNN